MNSLFTATKNNGVSAFQAKSSSVGGNIRPCLVNNADNAHRTAYLFNHKTVGSFNSFKHSAARVIKCHNLPAAVCHTLNPVKIKHKAVKHTAVKNTYLRIIVNFIGVNNFLCILDKCVCNSTKCFIFKLC